MTRLPMKSKQSTFMKQVLVQEIEVCSTAFEAFNEPQEEEFQNSTTEKKEESTIIRMISITMQYLLVCVTNISETNFNRLQVDIHFPDIVSLKLSLINVSLFASNVAR